MKVICAGLSKTGTKSMNAALTILGYSVYDIFENTEILRDGWEKIADGKISKELLREMYENVDASMDIPFCGFWEELLEAFPDAKVILTVRDTEEGFCKSVRSQMKGQDDAFGHIINWLSPTYASWMRLIARLTPHSFHFVDDFDKMRKRDPNITILKQVYRKHNAYVMQCCPKDQLLVFNCKEGWEPLCEFLGRPVPNQPFPHKNRDSEVIGEFMQSRTFRRVKTEISISSISLLVIAGIALYSFARALRRR